MKTDRFLNNKSKRPVSNVTGTWYQNYNRLTQWIIDITESTQSHRVFKITSIPLLSSLMISSIDDPCFVDCPLDELTCCNVCLHKTKGIYNLNCSSAF